jgi:hypothetical protein
MEKSFCSRLHILGWASARSLKTHLESLGAPVSLVHRAIVHLGLGRVVYHDHQTPPTGVLVLVSGSPAFLERSADSLGGHEVLFLGSEHRTSSRTPPGPARRRLRHRNFGGPTHFVALFGCQGVICQPVETALRRSVGHVFEFGARPEPLDGPDDLDSAMTIDGILHPSDLCRPIVHETSFFRSGWGVRSLTPDELGIAFGFPAWLRSGGLTADMFPLVPLQILDACIRELLAAEDFHTPLCAEVYAPPLPPTEATWLPALQRFLPHTWVPGSLVTDKAVKHDDAAVHTAMWDNRITLVFPWAPARAGWLLDYFRRQLMCHHRFRLMSEFRAYMTRHHGSDWAARLDIWRSRGLGELRPWRSRGSGGGRSSLKRKFVGAQPGRKRQKGGSGEISSVVDPAESGIAALATDAAVGQDILSKAVAADWWNWSGGSTLIFWRWPRGFQQTCARDGMPPWIDGTLPRFKSRAKTPKPEDATLLAPKFL